MTGDGERRDLRSFGRRRGRKPSERQASLLRELLPRVAVDLSAPCGWCPAGESQGASFGSENDTTMPAPCGRLPAGESQGANEYWLEIGFGGGEHLVWQAKAHPEVGFIGCEPFEDGVVKVLSAIEDAGLGNIRVHVGDARDVLRALPEASISRAFILFPDPWPKRKHRKRRLISAATLALLARVLRPGAELRVATDIGDYARTMLEAFAREPRFHWLAAGPADWRIRPPDWPETRYEAKAAQSGRRRYYFRFLRLGPDAALQGAEKSPI